MLTPPVAARNAIRTRSTASRSRSISDSFIAVLSNDGGAVNNSSVRTKKAAATSGVGDVNSRAERLTRSALCSSASIEACRPWRRSSKTD